MDLREDHEVKKHGSIEGAVFFTYQQVLEDGEDFEKFVDANMGKTIICYCAYGERSALARDQMLESGLTDVKHLSGGFNAYCEVGKRVKSKAS